MNKCSFGHNLHQEKGESDPQSWETSPHAREYKVPPNITSGASALPSRLEMSIMANVFSVTCLRAFTHNNLLVLMSHLIVCQKLPVSRWSFGGGLG